MRRARPGRRAGRLEDAGARSVPDLEDAGALGRCRGAAGERSATRPRRAATPPAPMLRAAAAPARPRRAAAAGKAWIWSAPPTPRLGGPQTPPPPWPCALASGGGSGWPPWPRPSATAVAELVLHLRAPRRGEERQRRPRRRPATDPRAQHQWRGSGPRRSGRIQPPLLKLLQAAPCWRRRNERRKEK